MNVSDCADKIFAEKRGIGMTPPFYAETASVKNDENWHYWIVRNKFCNSTGQFYTREFACALASAMNLRAGK